MLRRSSLLLNSCSTVATIPIDIELRKEESEDMAARYHELPEPDLAALEEKRKNVLEEAKENILSAQKKQKEVYDKKHAKPHLFEPGQLVLKKDFTRRKRKGGKLDSKFIGPFVIVKTLGKGTYLLGRPGTLEGTVQATGAHLKPYSTPPHDPSDRSSDESEDGDPILSAGMLVCPCDPACVCMYELMYAYLAS